MDRRIVWHTDMFPGMASTRIPNLRPLFRLGVGLRITFRIVQNHHRLISTGHNQIWSRNSTWDGTQKARRPRFGLSSTSTPKENTRLTEVITIYEKLTKSRDRETVEVDNQEGEDVFRPSSNYFDYLRHGGTEEEVKTGGSQFWSNTVQKLGSGDGSPKVLDFSKFRNSLGKNYSYFSAKTGLLQSHTLELLTWDGGGTVPAAAQSSDSVAAPPFPLDSSALLLQAKQFCLSIVNPTEKDLTFLGTQLNVHDLTLRDIREQNTEEKVEVFKHYTFLSLRPYLDGGTGEENKNTKGPLSNTANIDLNILLFPDFAIIVHYGHHWNGLKDMLGFLNLLCSYGNSPLTPDWVLFSIFIELAQDAKYSVKSLEPRILNLKVTENIGDAADASGSEKERLSAELSNVLTKNFENEFEIYKINRFIKPKIKVLRLLKIKCGNRVGVGVLNLLSGTRKEFEELGEALGHFSHILERSQDTCLTLANVRQSQEANMMGQSMKRISEVALIFLPLQALAGFLGMNVRVPFQDLESTGPFWAIITSSGILLLVLYRVSRATIGGGVKRVVKKTGGAMENFNRRSTAATKFMSQLKK